MSSKANKSRLSRKRKLSNEDRFPDYKPEEIAQKREGLKKVNTERSDKKCERIFVQWLERHKYNTDYWTEDMETLNDRLSKFWFEARTVNGDHYTTVSLGHFRYGINRCLVKHGSNYNIVDGTDFKPCQLAYSDACKELKKLGKGHRKSYPAITPKGKCQKYLEMH